MRVCARARARVCGHYSTARRTSSCIVKRDLSSFLPVLECKYLSLVAGGDGNMQPCGASAITLQNLGLAALFGYVFSFEPTTRPDYGSWYPV